MPVVYEVNLTVDADMAAEFQEWLGSHIDRMLALPGFSGARLMRVDAPSASGKVDFCTHYAIIDRSALEHYLQAHAPAMRAEGTRRFGERMSASRRILLPLDY